GDAVERGEIIAKVETGKGITEVEASTSGTVEKLMLQIGEKAPVGAVLATIREPGQSISREVLLQESQQYVAFRVAPEGRHQSGRQGWEAAVTSAQDPAQEAKRKEERERAEREAKEK